VSIRATVTSTGKIRYGVEQFATSLTATGTHMPYRITWCYLPPDRGNIPALTAAKAGTPFSDPGAMQGYVDLVGWLHTGFGIHFTKCNFPFLTVTLHRSIIQ